MRLEDDVAAAHGVVYVEPLWQGDEYSLCMARLT
jgi:diphthamide synthase (EF-2-diphthine--ammonia ligase)